MKYITYTYDLHIHILHDIHIHIHDIHILHIHYEYNLYNIHSHNFKKKFHIKII